MSNYSKNYKFKIEKDVYHFESSCILFDANEEVNNDMQLEIERFRQNIKREFDGYFRYIKIKISEADFTYENDTI